MNKHFLFNRIYPIFIFTLLFTACNGQIKTNVNSKSLNKSGTVKIGQPKLIKTQGSNVYENIHCGLQDRAGNLWFGTTGEGVYRFDGKLFTQFTEKDGLNSNKVWSMLEDNAGNIWIGTSNGICRYDGNKITRVYINVDFMNVIMYSEDTYYNDWTTSNTVWSIYQDRTGKIWFGTGGGLYCYNGRSFTRFLQNDGIINKEGLKLKMVDHILEDRNGNFWFASGMLPGSEGVCFFDGKSIKSFKPGGDGWIRNIIEDNNGVIWSGGRHHGVWRFDGKDFKKFTEKEYIGYPMLKDKAGNLWFNGEEKVNTIESENGIWRYDGKSFTNFSSKDGLSNYYAFFILEDRQSNIWVGTRNCGLYRFDGKSFTSYSE